MPASDGDTSVLVPASMEKLVDYQPGSVVSRAVIKKEKGTVTLFAFDAGESLSEHTAPFDALVQVFDGTAEVTIGKEKHQVAGGELLLLPANVPHAVNAKTRFKMLLIMIRS